QVGNDAARTADIEKGRAATGRNCGQLFAAERDSWIQDVLVELAGDQSGTRVSREQVAAIKGQHIQKPALLTGRCLLFILVVTGMLTRGATVAEAMNACEEGRIVDHQRKGLVEMIDHASVDGGPPGRPLG